MSRLRRPADGPLVLLLVLAVMLAIGLGTFIVRHTFELPYDPLVACTTFAATMLARVTALGVAAPLAVLSAMMIAGSVAFGHQIVTTRRTLKRILARAVTPPESIRLAAERAGLAGRIVLVEDGAAYSFCFGFIRPSVCLSTGIANLLDRSELAAVLAHEAHHMRYRDPLKILIGRTVASALFFLPLSGALRNGYFAGKELCADAHALALEGSLPLARALYKLLNADRPSWPMGALAIGALSPTEARLQFLLRSADAEPHQAWPGVLDWIVSLVLVAGIFGYGAGSVAASEAENDVTACLGNAMPGDVAVHESPALTAVAIPAGIERAQPCRGIPEPGECLAR